ncbi:MAG TPA: putative peptide modification system cyclase [Rhodanobacteraceae bacterium]
MLRTLVVCDIADSTALVEKLGDPQAAQLVRKHDRLARALLEQHHGREIDKTDGFLLLFERPIHAVAFALDYQRGLKHLSAAEGVVVRARVGIHMGDVVVWENSPEDVARGAKPTEIEGLAKPMAARLAQLAQPRQILLTAAAASLAHRAHGELGECAAHVRWRALGRYLFKGLPEAVEVHEVGEESVAAFRAPRGSRTAKRILPWWRRPAVLAAEAAMLAVAIAIPAWLSTRSEPALAFAARDWVVVGDLQNLTGNSSFDQSVETALRISLEQSRYVNVLPELKVQETLQRMERDPAKTVVDRGVGSEIALRDGARALVLPTLAEINGKLRVTAEVIDPKSQATVYSLNAEGSGASSLLASLDEVGKELRGRLGETLASISKNSYPLDRVATSNLDALRAYSLAVRAKMVGDTQDAIAFYQQALKLDPQFARVRLDLAGTYLDIKQRHAAIEQLVTAESNRDRLASRDRMLLDAWKATAIAPISSIPQWKTVAELYPDLFVASGCYGYFSWMYGNRFDTAETALSRSASPMNPGRVTSDFMLGVVSLGQEHYTEAEKHFAQAVAEGWTRGEYVAMLYAAQRQYSKVTEAIANGTTSGIPSGDMDATIVRIAMAIDQGKFDSARSQLEDAEHRVQSLGEFQTTRMASVRMVMETLKGLSATEVDHLVKVVERATPKNDDEGAVLGIRSQDALRAYLLARYGSVAEAKDAITRIGTWEGDGKYPLLTNLLTISRAEIARREGRAGEAIRLLSPLIDGTELYLTHVALMHAYGAANMNAQALAESQWLASHRGRAYTEYNATWTLTPLNMAQSNLALLSQAEYAALLGQKDMARSALDSFKHEWKAAMNVGEVAKRVHALERTLNG